MTTTPWVEAVCGSKFKSILGLICCPELKSQHTFRWPQIKFTFAWKIHFGALIPLSPCVTFLINYWQPFLKGKKSRSVEYTFNVYIHTALHLCNTSYCICFLLILFTIKTCDICFPNAPLPPCALSCTVSEEFQITDHHPRPFGILGELSHSLNPSKSLKCHPWQIMRDTKLVLSWTIPENTSHIIWTDGCNEYTSIVKQLWKQTPFFYYDTSISKVTIKGIPFI